MKKKPSSWIVTEGLKGTENQCLGIAEMLGLEPTLKTVSLRQPWRLLSPFLGFEQKGSFTGDPLAPPYPDILITGGRKTIAVSRYIKRKTLGETFTLHVLDPRISPKHFDLVAVPAHDPTRGENVIVTQATPNRITVRTLQEGKKNFLEFGDLPSPRLGILIGGNSKAYRFEQETAEKLVSELKKLEHTHSLIISMSRRTPPEIATKLRASLHGENTYIWEGTGDNPYFGLLAWADTLCVTADSTSMISEACTTGKPTYMIPLTSTGKNHRLKKFQNALIRNGALRPFDGILDTWRYTPLNDSQLVANEVKKRLPDSF